MDMYSKACCTSRPSAAHAKMSWSQLVFAVKQNFGQQILAPSSG
jgi:hypothetical protein